MTTTVDDACATMDRAIERIAFLEARVTELQSANERYRERATMVGGLNDRILRLQMDNERLRRRIADAISLLGRVG